MASKLGKNFQQLSCQCNLISIQRKYDTARLPLIATPTLIMAFTGIANSHGPSPQPTARRSLACSLTTATRPKALVTLLTKQYEDAQAAVAAAAARLAGAKATLSDTRALIDRTRHAAQQEAALHTPAGAATQAMSQPGQAFVDKSCGPGHGQRSAA